MQQKIRFFLELAGNFIAASEELTDTSDKYNELVTLGKELPYAEKFIGAAPLAEVLLLAIIQTSFEHREKALGTIISQILFYQPDKSVLKVLALMPRETLAKQLFPFIYLEGSKGSSACYLSSLVGLKISPDSVFHFLSARSWLKSDLINFARLIKSEQINEVLAEIDKNNDSEWSGKNSELVNEFRYLLFNGIPGEALMPDSLPESPVRSIDEKKLQQLAGEDNDFAQSKTPTASLSQPIINQSKAEKPSKTIDTEDFSQVKAVLTDWLDLKLVFPVCLIFVTLYLLSYFLGKDNLDPAALPSVRQKGTISQWTDSVTQETITSRHLAADKDYRMGELYLTRDMFAEAEKMFEDALNSFPDHPLAGYRSGYCNFFLKNYTGARQALEKVLKGNPGFKNANFLLARIAIDKGEYEKADAHFSRELEIAYEPHIAIFYADHLTNTGRIMESQRIRDKLHTMFPDKVFPESTGSSGGVKP